METVELAGHLDDGTSFTCWTFDRKVPGPMLRARAGDTVELTLANARDSKMIHSIDLHAVTGGHGLACRRPRPADMPYACPSSIYR
ncbi:hypothetical protein UB46_31640 [Burkholderiaceae bacterium 16]|nr:hypothetical protein UB46_31640 [Burkholderiaceae bacterium 16]